MKAVNVQKRKGIVDGSIPTLGERLRALRQERNLTLATVAEGARISASFLSLVETNKHDISMGRLSRLLDFYETDIRHFVQPKYESAVVLMQEDLPHEAIVSPQEGIELAFLAPGRRHVMIPVVVTVKSRGSWLDYSSHHGEEMVYVLEGEFRAEVGDMSYDLTRDSSLMFDAALPHRFENLRLEPSKLLSVMVASPSNGDQNWRQRKMHEAAVVSATANRDYANPTPEVTREACGRSRASSRERNPEEV